MNRSPVPSLCSSAGSGRRPFLFYDVLGGAHHVYLKLESAHPLLEVFFHDLELFDVVWQVIVGLAHRGSSLYRVIPAIIDDLPTPKIGRSSRHAEAVCHIGGDTFSCLQISNGSHLSFSDMGSRLGIGPFSLRLPGAISSIQEARYSRLLGYPSILMVCVRSFPCSR